MRCPVAERIAIVGARDASPETLAQVRELVESLPDGTIVVSGGAAGVDSEAAKHARNRGLVTLEFSIVKTIMNRHTGAHFLSVDVKYGEEDPEPHVSFFGTPLYRDALIFRNTLIAIECDRMVAFVEGSKGGTWDAVAQAKRFRRPCEVRR